MLVGVLDLRLRVSAEMSDEILRGEMRRKTALLLRLWVEVVDARRCRGGVKGWKRKEEVLAEGGDT